MAKKPIKETIHAKGLDISIYTNDFENEYVSLTDIAKYRSSDPQLAAQPRHRCIPGLVGEPAQSKF